jgi:uncharacterized membrane protein SpoIIM required for sporulation
VFTAVGAIANMTDQNFVREILGDEYVNMTQENIDNGDPFGVYKNENEMAMFLSIAVNNIWVSFNVFSQGIFFGIFSEYFEYLISKNIINNIQKYNII